MFLMSKSKAFRVTDERGNSELLSRGDRQQLKDSENIWLSKIVVTPMGVTITKSARDTGVIMNTET